MAPREPGDSSAHLQEARYRCSWLEMGRDVHVVGAMHLQRPGRHSPPIQLLNRCLLRPYCVLGTVMGAEGIAKAKRDKIHALMRQ